MERPISLAMRQAKTDTSLDEALRKMQIGMQLQARAGAVFSADGIRSMRVLACLNFAVGSINNLLRI